MGPLAASSTSGCPTPTGTGARFASTQSSSSNQRQHQRHQHRPHQQLLLLHQAHAHGEEGPTMGQAGQLKDIKVLPVEDLQHAALVSVAVAAAAQVELSFGSRAGGII